MNTLFVSPRQCWPATGGAKLREYHFAKALEEQGHLHYVFFSSAGAAPPTTKELAFSSITPVPPIQGYTVKKLIGGLVGRWPLSVRNYWSEQMAGALRTVARESPPFDVVHLDSPHLVIYEDLLRSLLPKAQIFYDWHNIESDILRQFAKNGPSAPKRLYARITASKMGAVEARILRTADGHVVCSEREKTQLLTIAPKARIEVIANGVDVQRFPAEATRGEGRTRLLFVGLMNYHANVEAALWFTQRLWPRIREQFPALRLTLVGADPVPQIRALAELPGVEVTGTVPRVEPYYDEALAAIVPLRTGGGTRLKILEAMAAGVPVISTELGAEGLDVTPGQDILLAPSVDSPELERRWCSAVATVAGDDPAEWIRLSRAGRQLVERHYDWARLRQQLAEIYRRWIGS